VAKPKLGISTLYCLSEPFKEMTAKISNANDTFIEIVDEGLHTLNKQRAKKLKEIAQSHNLEYSVHAPFAGINIANPTRTLLTATMKRLKGSIQNARRMETQLWIFHPGMETGTSMIYPGQDWKRNIQSIQAIFTYAKDNGLEAAIENVMPPFIMKTVGDFTRFYHEINEDIGLVLDTGHANITNQLDSFLTLLPNKIRHVHAHDNHGKYDEHLGIGHGNIDWKNFATKLKRASYDRTIVIEAAENVEESKLKLQQLFK
jgi:sugar phosphate isomerase/epimerase